MVNVLLVIYTRKYVDECLFRLNKISKGLFPSESVRFIISDTSEEGGDVIVNNLNEYYLSPGNSHREFYGWDYAFQFAKEKFSLSNDDIFIITNDTFYRNYGDEYLEGFYQKDLYKLKYSRNIVGYVDAYPQSVSMGEVTFREWVRTSFFITGYNVLREVDFFKNPYEKYEVFNSLDFFAIPSQLSENYRSYILSWLFSDAEARPEFPYKWHSAKAYEDSNREEMIQKAYCILSEHFISWHANKMEVDIISVNEEKKEANIDLYMRTFMQFSLGIKNKEINNANVAQLLIHDAYWAGRNNCHASVKIAWLSIQDWAQPYFYPESCESYSPYTPTFKLKDIFLEFRPDLKERYKHDGSYLASSLFFDLFFGGINNDFFIGKPEMHWLEQPSEATLPSLEGFELSRAFQLIYKYGMKKHPSFSDEGSKNDAYFLGYLLVYSKMWSGKVSANAYLHFIAKNKGVFSTACYEFIYRTFGIRLPSMREVLGLLQKDAYVGFMDKALFLCILKIYDAEYLVSNIDMTPVEHIKKQYIWQNFKGSYERDYFLSLELSRFSEPCILEQLHFGLLIDFLEYYSLSAEQVYNFNSSSRFQFSKPKNVRKKIDNKVSVIGFSRSELGTGEDTRNTVKVLESLNYNISVYSLLPNEKVYAHSELSAVYAESMKLDNIQIYTMPATTYMSYYLSNNDIRNCGGYKIGYFAWEFSEWKNEYDIIYDIFDEIWVISHFLIDAFDSSRIPVHYVPPVVTQTKPLITIFDARQAFELPHDEFLFLSIFDIKSSTSRKNPLAVIQGFLSAFSENDNVGLVMKFSYDDGDYENNRELFELIKTSKKIYHISDMLCKSEIEALIAQSNVVVSLHRSEGFGRVIAEAMLLETAVICTNYSGNLDFCNEYNSLLVDYDLVKVDEAEYSFAKGLKWADVKHSSVVEKMREAVNSSDKNAERIKIAYNTIIKNHSVKVAATRVKELLAN